MSERAKNDDPVLLAVETSQRDGSVALQVHGGIRGCLHFPCGARHEDRLLPSIDELFRASGLQPGDLDAVAVSIGPGGFTGLRIAVGTAKGIAETTGCSTIAVPSAFVAAEAVRAQVEPMGRVVVASASKQDTCWLTLLECAPDGWREIEGGGIHVVDPPAAETIALCEGAIVLADEHVPLAFREAVSGIAAGLDEPCLDAEACARVGGWMFEHGQIVDPLDIKPLYPREPEAVRSWRLRNG